MKQIWTLILYAKAFERNEILTLPDEEEHYVRNVLRLQLGDSVCVSNGIGTKGEAVIVAMDKQKCFIKLTGVVKKKAPFLPVHLLLAQTKRLL